VDWVPYDLKHMDSVYEAPIRSDIQTLLSRRPSEYWFSNCFNSGSFLSREEVSLREAVGRDNLMWASDYPHAEGTFPNSLKSIRHTFHDVPEAETRRILGENALALFSLDARYLSEVAAKIGPGVEQVAVPLGPDEIPEWTGYGFRRIGTFA
jgi:hypothetical protein